MIPIRHCMSSSWAVCGPRLDWWKDICITWNWVASKHVRKKVRVRLVKCTIWFVNGMVQVRWWSFCLVEWIISNSSSMKPSHLIYIIFFTENDEPYGSSKLVEPLEDHPWMHQVEHATKNTPVVRQLWCKLNHGASIVDQWRPRSKGTGCCLACCLSTCVN